MYISEEDEINEEVKAFFQINFNKIESKLQEYQNNPSEELSFSIPISGVKFRVYKSLEKKTKANWKDLPILISYDSESLLERSKMIIKTFSKEEAANLKFSKNEELDFAEIRGFREVVDIIRESKAPIATHNGMMDLLHVIFLFISFIIDFLKNYLIILQS